MESTLDKINKLKHYLKSKRQSSSQKQSWIKNKFNYRVGINSYVRRKKALNTGKEGQSSSILNTLIKSKKKVINESIAFTGLNLNEFLSNIYSLISELHSLNRDNLFENYSESCEFQILIEDFKEVANGINETTMKLSDVEFILMFFQEELSKYLNEDYNTESSLVDILLKI